VELRRNWITVDPDGNILERGYDGIFADRYKRFLDDQPTIEWIFHPRDFKALLHLSRKAVADGSSNGYTCRPIFMGRYADWASITVCPAPPGAAMLMFRWQDGEKYRDTDEGVLKKKRERERERERANGVP